MNDAPKSAYEIAMEKLRRQDREKGESGPASLSEAQKQRIAEIRRKFEARFAEREILYRGERGRAAQDPEGGAAKLEELENEYARDRARFEAERQREIDAARAADAPAEGPPSRGAGTKAGGKTKRGGRRGGG